MDLLTDFYIKEVENCIAQIEKIENLEDNQTKFDEIKDIVLDKDNLENLYKKVDDIYRFVKSLNRNDINNINIADEKNIVDIMTNNTSYINNYFN